MHRKVLIISIILFGIIPLTAATSPPSCDAFNVALTGNPVITAVSGSGNAIAIGGAGGIIGTFTARGSPRWVYQTEDNVTGIAISHDGRSVTASTFHGNLFYFDENGGLIWNISGFGCNSHVALSGDGKEGYVFSGSPTHDLTGDTVFHFASNGSVLSRLPVPGVSSHDLSTDGRIAVVSSGGLYGNNYVVAIDGTGIQWEKKIPSQWQISDVAVSDNCRTVAAIESNSLTGFSCSGNILWNTSTKYIAKSVALSGDGQQIVVGTQYQILNFNRSGNKVWEYSVPDYVGRVKASGDGTKIVAATRQTLHYIDGNGTSIWQYPMHDRPESLSMSGNGDLIAVGTYNNTFSLFDGRGKVTDVDLSTVSVMPIVTEQPEHHMNSPVSSMKSPPVSLTPALSVIAFGSLSVIWWWRKR